MKYLPSTSMEPKHSANKMSWRLLHGEKEKYRYNSPDAGFFTGEFFLDESKTEFAMLLARKKKLSYECIEIERQIKKKQQILTLLQENLEQTMADYQSASAGKLAAGLVHEIRNPLTTIKGFIQLLKPELSLLKKEEFADVALDEINRANDLIGDFLTVLKPGPREKSLFSLKETIGAIEKLFLSEALLEQISLSFELPAEEIFILANERQLKQVLINLLKNAFEAVMENGSSKEGAVKTTVSTHGSFVRISIQDNGVGISSDTIDKLFTPFFTTKEKGTGIGLVICKQIIESHGGELKVESEMGIGTVFSITLPLG